MLCRSIYKFGVYPPPPNMVFYKNQRLEIGGNMNGGPNRLSIQILVVMLV